MKQYWADNPEKYQNKLRQEALKKRDPDKWAKYRLSVLKTRSKIKGYVFDLEEEDLVLPEYCPVLGIKLELGLPAHHPQTPHVDRIHNDLGYIKGNVAIISSRANLIKRDATVEEVRAVLAYMEQFDE